MNVIDDLINATASEGKEVGPFATTGADCIAIQMARTVATRARFLFDYRMRANAFALKFIRAPRRSN